MTQMQPGQPGQPGGDGQRIVYVQAPKPPWYKRAGCVVPLVLVVLMILGLGGCMSLFVKSVNDAATTPSVTKNESSESNGKAGSSSGGTDGSATAQLGDTVHLKKADVVASNLRDQGANVLGDNHLCADVSVTNTSSKDTVRLNGLTDWKLEDANGVVIDQTIVSEATDYDAVELKPGGSKTGVVCFKHAADPGSYKITFEEGLSLLSDQATWVAQLP